MVSLLACLLAAAPPAAAQPAPMSDAAFGALLGQVAQQALKKPVAPPPRPAKKDPYPRLKSSAQGSDGVNDMEIEVESWVETTTDIPESFRVAVRKFYEPFGQEPPKVDKLYHYHYKIVNKGDAGLQVNFSDWDFTHSPFTEVLQGFHLEVPPRRAYKLSYVSTRAPKAATSPMNVGIRDPKTGRFSYVGAGRAGLYYADWPEPFEPVDNGLLPPPDPRKP